MSIRYSHEERADALRAQLSGQAPASTKSDKAGSSRILFTATLHAASRRSKGYSLSPLEKQLVDALEIYVAPDEVSRYGKIYSDVKSKALSLEIIRFSASILKMDEAAPYTNEELIRDARAATPEILSNPANSIVEISSVANDDSVEDYDDSDTISIGYPGGGVTVFTSGPEQEMCEPKEVNSDEKNIDFIAPVLTGQLPNLQRKLNEIYSSSNLYRISMDRFKCLRKQSDEIFGDKNEIYWAVASGADSAAEKSFKTQEYGSIVDGTQVTFSGVDFFFGDVMNRVAGHIECWEADDSSSNFYDEMNKALKSMAGFAIDAAVNAAATDDWGDPSGGTGTGTAILALTALFAYLLGDLIMFIKNDDDFIQKHDIAFTKSALGNIINAQPNGEISLIFDGGSNGKHQLWIRVSRPPGIVGTLQCYRWSNESWWAPVPIPSGNSPHGMSLADHHGELVGIFRESGNTIKWTKYSGNTWSIPKPLTITSPSRPALATHADRLWCLYRDTSNGIRITSTASDLNSWTPASSLQPTAATSDNPALASYKGKLHSIARGTDNRVYWSWSNESGGSWVNYRKFGGASISASPSLCVFGGRLQLALRGANNTLYIASFDGSSWSAMYQQVGSLRAGPTLAARDGKMFVLQQGLGDERFWFKYLDSAKVWTANRNIGNGITGEVGACSFGGHLWAFYGWKA